MFKLVNNALDKHIQAKTDDNRVPHFGDILAPLLRKLNDKTDDNGVPHFGDILAPLLRKLNEMCDLKSN